MSNLIMSLSALCIGIQFNINKYYQKHFVKNFRDILLFLFVTDLVVTPVFFLLNIVMYGKIEFSSFSLFMSVFLTITGVLCTITGLQIMKYGSVLVYSVFMMLGGMMLPYFFGIIFLGENLSAARVIGVIILVCALPCSAAVTFGGKSNSAKFYLLCILIFFLNGTISILSKTHSIDSSAIPATTLLFYIGVLGIILNGAIYFISACPGENPVNREGNNTSRLRAIVPIVFYAITSSVGYLLQLIAAKTVPAVVLYPFGTGGGIVTSTMLARVFFKEKPGTIQLVGLILSFSGTLFFLFD